jgi:hypothetical protein
MNAALLVFGVMIPEIGGGISGGSMVKLNLIVTAPPMNCLKAIANMFAENIRQS